MSLVQFCEKCGKENDGSFATGRFCSRSCANSRIHSTTTKTQISKSLSGRKTGRPMSDETKQKLRVARIAQADKLPQRVRRTVINITRGEIKIYKTKHSVCEICGKRCLTGRSLAIDHDHKTLEFRGLLCAKCNMNYDWYLTNVSGIEAYTNK